MVLKERSPDDVDQQTVRDREEDVKFGRLLTQELEEPWYKSVYRSIKEIFNPPKLPPLEVTSRPVYDARSSFAGVEEPFFKSLVRNIKETINPPKLPPLEITSKPVEVKDIWSTHGKEGARSGVVSIGVHLGIIALLFAIFTTPVVRKKVQEAAQLIYVPPYQPPPAAQAGGGGGGGGMRAPKPVSKGMAPKFAPKTFTPPAPVVQQPKLAQPPEISAEAPKIQADNYGDPLSKNMPFSGGEGINGMGKGSGGGLGPGNGSGYGPGTGGNTGGGAYRIGNGVSAPSILSKVEPEYSEEARKAKFQGTVSLRIVVDERGMPRDLKVIRPLGLGLDEKAIEAVEKWRFRPGMKDGKAVATLAVVEVNFRLL